MKHSLHGILTIVIILALVLSFGITGCGGDEETTPATSSPTTTSPSPSTTTPEETTTPPPEETTTPPPEETTTPPPEETTTPPPEETTTPPPEETTTPAVANVYVSVSVDGELLLAAQPVVYAEGMTLDDVISAAHEAYYADGLDGYATYTDPMWGYMISDCWGISNAPYVVVNDAPIAASVNAISVDADDNVIIYTGADTSTISPVSLTATVSDDSVTVTAKVWTFSWTTFVWSSVLLADANVVDPVTSELLGTTDANGQSTVTIPDSGIVAIEGMAAIKVREPVTTPPETTTPEGPGVIAWEDAINHIGELVTVEGPIIDMFDIGTQYVLGMGISAVVAGSVGIEISYALAPELPADMFVGQTIRVTGTPYANAFGGASIVVAAASDIEVVE